MLLIHLNRKVHNCFDTPRGGDDLLASISPGYVDETILERLVSSVQIAGAYTNPREADHVVKVSAYNTQRHYRVDAPLLSKRWRIGLESAKQTLLATTQRGLRHAVQPLTRRYRTDLLSLRYRRLNGVMYSDTMFSRYKSIIGNTCAQMFTIGGLVRAGPMATKGGAGYEFDTFVQDVGAPNNVVVDNVQEQVAKGSYFQKVARFHHARVHQTEPYTSKQNRAEDQI